jgi:hypothetical protein
MPVGLSLLWQDELGVEYDLLTNLIDFEKLVRGTTEKVMVVLKNQDIGRLCNNIVLTPIAHPTNQLGTAEDTYDATDLSLSESGPFSSPLNIAILAPNSETDIWIRWAIAPGALPGDGQFAVKAEGEYIL